MMPPPPDDDEGLPLLAGFFPVCPCPSTAPSAGGRPADSDSNVAWGVACLTRLRALARAGSMGLEGLGGRGEYEVEGDPVRAAGEEEREPAGEAPLPPEPDLPREEPIALSLCVYWEYREGGWKIEVGACRVVYACPERDETR